LLILPYTETGYPAGCPLPTLLVRSPALPIARVDLDKLWLVECTLDPVLHRHGTADRILQKPLRQEGSQPHYRIHRDPCGNGRPADIERRHDRGMNVQGFTREIDITRHHDRRHGARHAVVLTVQHARLALDAALKRIE